MTKSCFEMMNIFCKIRISSPSSDYE